MTGWNGSTIPTIIKRYRRSLGCSSTFWKVMDGMVTERRWRCFKNEKRLFSKCCFYIFLKIHAFFRQKLQNHKFSTDPFSKKTFLQKSKNDSDFHCRIAWRIRKKLGLIFDFWWYTALRKNDS